MKRIAVMGTNHCVQNYDYQRTGQFKQVLSCLLEKFRTEVILEETDWYEQTVGHQLADGREPKVPWEPVRTPETPDFWPTDQVEAEMRITVHNYGPMQKQTNRERFMKERIIEVMAGLFVCGLGHLQSMAEKLISAGFEVEAFEWQQPAP